MITTLTDIKLSKSQISKINQLDRSFDSWLSYSRKKALANSPISLSRNNLPWLVSYVTSNAVNEFERRTSGRQAVIAGKGFTLFLRMKKWMMLLKS